MHHQSSRQLQDSPFWATAGLGLLSLAFQGVLKGDCEGLVSVAPERLCSPSVRLCVAHTVTSGRLWAAPLCTITTHLASGEKEKPSSGLPFVPW